MNAIANFPVGFRFQPRDAELIKSFLIPKVKGFPLPWNVIVEKELYGKNASPREVFNDIDDASPSLYYNTIKDGNVTTKTAHVFTKVAKAAPNSTKRISRVAGCGTWTNQTGSTYVTDPITGANIGFTRMFSFKHKGDSKRFGHWTMHEYSLRAKWSNDFVLCRITRYTKDKLMDRDRKKQKLSAKDLENMLMHSDDDDYEEVAGVTDFAKELEKILMR